MQGSRDNGIYIDKEALPPPQSGAPIPPRDVQRVAGMPQQTASLRQALEDARHAIDTAIRILDEATQPPAAATKKEAAEATAADDAKRKAGIS